MEDGVRVVVASCVIHRGVETYSTTVIITIDSGLSHFELSNLIRMRAAEQMQFCNNAQPVEVIVLNQEDVTYFPDHIASL